MSSPRPKISIDRCKKFDSQGRFDLGATLGELIKLTYNEHPSLTLRGNAKIKIRGNLRVSIEASFWSEDLLIESDDPIDNIRLLWLEPWIGSLRSQRPFGVVACLRDFDGFITLYRDELRACLSGQEPIEHLALNNFHRALTGDKELGVDPNKQPYIQENTWNVMIYLSNGEVVNTEELLKRTNLHYERILSVYRRIFEKLKNARRWKEKVCYKNEVSFTALKFEVEAQLESWRYCQTRWTLFKNAVSHWPSKKSQELDYTILDYKRCQKEMEFASLFEDIRKQLAHFIVTHLLPFIKAKELFQKDKDESIAFELRYNCGGFSHYFTLLSLADIEIIRGVFHTLREQKFDLNTLQGDLNPKDPLEYFSRLPSLMKQNLQDQIQRLHHPQREEKKLTSEVKDISVLEEKQPAEIERLYLSNLKEQTQSQFSHEAKFKNEIEYQLDFLEWLTGLYESVICGDEKSRPPVSTQMISDYIANQLLPTCHPQDLPEQVIHDLLVWTDDQKLFAILLQILREKRVELSKFFQSSQLWLLNKIPDRHILQERFAGYHWFWHRKCGWKPHLEVAHTIIFALNRGQYHPEDVALIFDKYHALETQFRHHLLQLNKQNLGNFQNWERSDYQTCRTLWLIDLHQKVSTNEQAGKVDQSLTPLTNELIHDYIVNKLLPSLQKYDITSDIFFKLLNILGKNAHLVLPKMRELFGDLDKLFKMHPLLWIFKQTPEHPITQMETALKQSFVDCVFNEIFDLPKEIEDKNFNADDKAVVASAVGNMFHLVQNYLAPDPARLVVSWVVGDQLVAASREINPHRFLSPKKQSPTEEKRAPIMTHVSGQLSFP